MPSFALTRRRALQGVALAALPLKAWAQTPALTFLAIDGNRIRVAYRDYAGAELHVTDVTRPA